jgi:uncharacterized protein (UPF0264 family)
MGNPLDSLAVYLAKRMAFGKKIKCILSIFSIQALILISCLGNGERDILIMHHEINYKWPNGKDETRTIDFIQYGDVKGYTAMAKTVGLPTAIAAKMLLESKHTNEIKH